MKKIDKFKDAKAARGNGQYFPLPCAVIQSNNFAKLSAHAVKLLMDLLAQWRGVNNGDLCSAWTVMSKRGWKSRATLDRARKELLLGEWIMLTRQGGRHVASLYAVTFHAINACGGKLEVQATLSPPGHWRKNEPLPNMTPTRWPRAKEAQEVYSQNAVTRSRCQLSGTDTSAVLGEVSILPN